MTIYRGGYLETVMTTVTYVINSNDRQWIKDTIMIESERKPEGDVMWSFSSPEMCKLCQRGLEVQKTKPEKSKNEFVYV